MKIGRMKHASGGNKVKNPGSKGGKVVGMRANGTPIYASQVKDKGGPKSPPLGSKVIAGLKKSNEFWGSADGKKATAELAARGTGFGPPPQSKKQVMAPLYADRAPSPVKKMVPPPTPQQRMQSAAKITRAAEARAVAEVTADRAAGRSHNPDLHGEVIGKTSSGKTVHLPTSHQLPTINSYHHTSSSKADLHATQYRGWSGKDHAEAARHHAKLHAKGGQYALAHDQLRIAHERQAELLGR